MFLVPLQVGESLAAAVLIAYSIHVVTRAQSLREYSDIHGSARWAKLSDIENAGLINQEGVYVGEWKNGSKVYTLRHNGPEHVLCYAPPAAHCSATVRLRPKSGRHRTSAGSMQRSPARRKRATTLL